MPLVRTGNNDTYYLPNIAITSGVDANIADYLCTFLLDCLGHDDQSAAIAWGDVFGCRMQKWYKDNSTFPFDHAILTNTDTCVVAIHGSQNIGQFISYLLAITPIYCPLVQGWVVTAFWMQAVWIFNHMQRLGLFHRRYKYYKIWGHSAGGSAGMLLSLLIKKYYTLRNVSLRTYGEAKSIGQFRTVAPDSHVRVVACSQPHIDGRIFDGVSFLPPSILTYAAIGKIAKFIGYLAPIVKYELSISPEPHGQEIWLDPDGHYPPYDRFWIDNFLQQLGLAVFSQMPAVLKMHLLDNSYHRNAYIGYRRNETNTPLPTLFVKSEQWLEHPLTNMTQGANMTLTDNQLAYVFNSWKNQWLSDHASWNGVTPSGVVPVRPSGENIIYNVVVAATAPYQLVNGIQAIPPPVASFLKQRVLNSWYAALNAAQNNPLVNAAIQELVPAAPDISGGSWDDGGTGDYGAPTPQPPATPIQTPQDWMAWWNTMNPTAQVDINGNFLTPIAPSGTTPVQNRPVVLNPQAVQNGTVTTAGIGYLRPRVVPTSASNFGVAIEGQVVLQYNNRPAAQRAAHAVWQQIRGFANEGLLPYDFQTALTGYISLMQSLSVNEINP